MIKFFIISSVCYSYYNLFCSKETTQEGEVEYQEPPQTVSAIKQKSHTTEYLPSQTNDSSACFQYTDVARCQSNGLTLHENDPNVSQERPDEIQQASIRNRKSSSRFSVQSVTDSVELVSPHSSDRSRAMDELKEENSNSNISKIHLQQITEDVSVA